MTTGARGAPSIVLLTRDLRVDDNPALARAAEDGPVVALFVLDERLLRSPTTGPNRVAFLLDSLGDLRRSLRERGGELFLRRGDPASVAAAAAARVGARTVHLAADVTSTARRRHADLVRRCAVAGVRVAEHPGIAVVDPSALRPTGGGDHYRVFTPYSRAWRDAPRRALLAAPASLEPPGGIEPGELPTLRELAGGADPVGRRRFAPLEMPDPSPERDRGGEHAAWLGLDEFAGLAAYAERASSLRADATTRVAAHLHFGCVSPAALERWALEHASQDEQDGTPPAPGSPGGPGAGVEAFVRQLCWRDFFLSVTRAFPSISRTDYRPRPTAWRRDERELSAWKKGRTGVDIVDAAMRQLLAEGFVHGRARLVASSYLVKTLRHHWTEGAAHYLYWLSDGDVASNSGNWQWMAGTGNDTRPNRVLNPVRQAERWDADGAYRARYLGSGAAQSRLPWC